MTPIQAAVLRVLAASDQPLTAQQIHDQLPDDVRPVTKATRGPAATGGTRLAAPLDALCRRWLIARVWFAGADAYAITDRGRRKVTL